MINLYYDDFQDERLYTDADVMTAIQSLVRAGETERSVLDYKVDISDGWAEAAASFANTFGGIILFGIEERQGSPVSVVGFDPQGKETKTRLVSSLLSRVQPTPDFRIRVVSIPTNPTREVAALRILEGMNSPYIYSKGPNHRTYVRMGAQKAEADYLQILALFEKRKKSDVSVAARAQELTCPQSLLNVYDPVGSRVVNRNSYRFVIAPHDERASRPLTLIEERSFEDAILKANESSNPGFSVRRNARSTCLSTVANGPIERSFAVSSSGSIGFTSGAGLHSDGHFFVFIRQFSEDLVRFIRLGNSFYAGRRYFGVSRLEVELKLLDACRVFNDDRWLQGRTVFEPRLDRIGGSTMTTAMDISTQHYDVESLRNLLEAILNEFARTHGHVFNPDCRQPLTKYLSEIMDRFK